MSDSRTVLSFESHSGGRALRKGVLDALRLSESPVIVDLAGRRTLDQSDIDVLLDCVSQASGRDAPLFLVAGSAVIRVLLEVTRISAIVPVFNSIEDALSDPRMAGQNTLVRGLSPTNNKCGSTR